MGNSFAQAVNIMSRTALAGDLPILHSAHPKSTQHVLQIHPTRCQSYEKDTASQPTR